MVYARIYGGQKFPTNYLQLSLLFGKIPSTKSLSTPTPALYTESQMDSALATGLIKTCMINGCGGLCPGNLEYTNTTRRIGSYIFKEEDNVSFYDKPAETCPMNFAVSISVSTVANRFKTEIQALQFNIFH